MNFWKKKSYESRPLEFQKHQKKEFLYIREWSVWISVRDQLYSQQWPTLPEVNLTDAQIDFPSRNFLTFSPVFLLWVSDSNKRLPSECISESNPLFHHFFIGFFLLYSHFLLRFPFFYTKTTMMMIEDEEEKLLIPRNLPLSFLLVFLFFSGSVGLTVRVLMQCSRVRDSLVPPVTRTLTIPSK